MIYSQCAVSLQDVSFHYDELDSLYRTVWGTHVHHGYWKKRNETKEQAVLNLVQEVARLIKVNPQDHIGDIGCGYGETAAWFSRNFPVKVTGLTISKKQYEFAKEKHRDISELKFELQDWLNNSFVEQYFNHLISIESSEHMIDKEKFFSEAYRTLKPGGSFVICAWLASENPSRFEMRFLLKPICEEGRLPSMGTVSDYIELFKNTGFQFIQFTDLTDSVKKTWTLCVSGFLKHLFKNPKDIKYLLRSYNTNSHFAKTLLRLRMAYGLKAMRYGIFLGKK